MEQGYLFTFRTLLLGGGEGCKVNERAVGIRFVCQMSILYVVVNFLAREIFYFSYVSTSLAYITINKRKTKIK